MRALWFDGELRLDDVPVPQPQKGEALIRVLAAGICNTDLEITKGYMKFTGIPGHEFVGIVEKSPDEYWVGKRVVGEINCPCGVCTYCRLEMPRHCPNRSVLGIQNRNGAFAEFLTLPVNNLHLVPNSIRDDVAVFTEPLAAAFRILEQTQITGEHRVLILGDGKLAQLVAQVIWLKTKRVQCMGKHESKLELLRRLGIPCMSCDEPIEPGADIVVEATGSKEGLMRAMELVRPEGTIVLKTTVAGTHDVAMSIPVIQEIKIIGSRCGPFRPALDALAVGIVEVRPLITEIFGIEHAVQAFQRAAQPDAMKVIVHM